MVPASGWPMVPPSWKVPFVLNVPPPPSTVYHGTVKMPPTGVGVMVGVLVGVKVGVLVGVLVIVLVGVFVGVLLAVNVGVLVGVLVLGVPHVPASCTSSTYMEVGSPALSPCTRNLMRTIWPAYGAMLNVTLVHAWVLLHTCMMVANVTPLLSCTYASCQSKVIVS